jgi:uncharacterized OB-fold protein
MTQEQRRPQKLVPQPNAETQFFWDKANEDELWIQRCNQCNKPYFYPRFFCPRCLSKDVEWFRTSGKGKLHTYMINHRPAPGFEDEAPYAIAVVELDEGVRMMSNIHGIENTPENLVLDMPLEVVFEEIAPGRKVPYWKPAQA